MKGGEPLGFGVAEYSDYRTAEATQLELNHYKLDNYNIRVTYCSPGQRAGDVYARLVSGMVSEQGWQFLQSEHGKVTAHLKKIPWNLCTPFFQCDLLKMFVLSVICGFKRLIDPYSSELLPWHWAVMKYVKWSRLIVPDIAALLSVNLLSAGECGF